MAQDDSNGVIAIPQSVYLMLGLMQMLKPSFKTAFIISLLLVSCSGKSPTDKILTGKPLPDKIRVGIRIGAEKIGKVDDFIIYKHWSGYCKEFADELRKQLDNNGAENKVELQEIKNEYLGKDYTRYDGLKVISKEKGTRETFVDIQCGPNSVPKNIKKIKPWMKFSRPFLSGVNKKMLLNTKRYSTTATIPIEELKSMPIGVFADTNTETEFKEAGYNIQPFEKIDDLMNALKAGADDPSSLSGNPIYAYANDTLILETHFKEYLKSNSIFSIYPQKDTLPGVDNNFEYAIAVSRDTTYAVPLLDLVNKTVDALARKKTLTYKESEILNKPNIFYQLLLALFVLVFFSLLIPLAKKIRHKITFNKLPPRVPSVAEGKPLQSKTKVFIAHGRDGYAKVRVARFIERLGLEAVILEEQVSEGNTIIEKFERLTNVGFAIVLYTECDTGSFQGEVPKPRARQNVIFEHGFLVSKLGPQNVCLLVKSGVELPSDIRGIVHEVLDEGGAWRIDVAKALKNAGYFIDLNKLLTFTTRDSTS
jgi:hypothetical protein